VELAFSRIKGVHPSNIDTISNGINVTEVK